MRVLVIAPHGDDEILGCGGTISKLTSNGHIVDLCIVTKPHIPQWSEEYIKNRKTEIAKSCKLLNIDRIISLGFNTIQLSDIPHNELNESISRIIGISKPNIIFMPFINDMHKDHQIVAESVLVSSRPIKYKIEKIVMYETLSETEWGSKSFKPNIYEDISDFMHIKKKAMKCYKSELKKFPHPRSLEGIEILAKKRGSEVNIKYAEAFELIREVII